MITCPPILPGKTPQALELKNSQIPSKQGNAIFSGYKHPPSFRWLFKSYNGLMSLQIYLWLIKDWSWSQLHWFWTGMLFGCLSMISMTCIICIALYKKVYSEALVALGLGFWLMSNFWWMLGEMWPLFLYKQDTEAMDKFWIPQLMEEYEYDGGDLFYERITKEAQILSIIATAIMFFSVFVLPWLYFDRDRVQKVCQGDDETLPRYRFGTFFRDFLEYENLDMFFWALKDCFWIHGDQAGYVIGLILTLIFMGDTIYLYCTSEGHLIELVHCLILLLWVIANGFWAYGELFIEDPKEDQISGLMWENYQFVPIQEDSITFFRGRNLAGWCYLIAAMLVVVFYIHWIWNSCFLLKSNEKASSESMQNEKKQDLEAKKLANG